MVIFNAMSLYFYNLYQKVNDKPVSNVFENIAIDTTRERLEVNETVYAGRRTAITAAVEVIEPTVVSVNVLKSVVVRRHSFFDAYFQDFFGIPLRREVSSIGSGVLISNDGYIITNSHVVEGATQIKVVMNNSTEFDAILVGIDSVHDLAVIKIEGTDLPYAKLGTSADLLIGEWSIAVGNPYGFLMKDSKPSVSVGVISALDRNFTNPRENKIYKGMIQTDAAINPGNSGGPLVNVHGEVVGINSFIFSESGGSVGIGFAIPIDRAKRIVDELIEHGMIREAYFGFKIQDLTPMIANHLKLNNLDGVIISNVDNNGPANSAGLKRGDIIVRINEIIIRNSADAELAVSDISPGDEVVIAIKREGKDIEMRLIAR
jgi:serine protease Do